MGIKTRKVCDDAILYVHIHTATLIALAAQGLNGTVFYNHVYIHW
jgi:hypothetical protein